MTTTIANTFTPDLLEKTIVISVYELGHDSKTEENTWVPEKRLVTTAGKLAAYVVYDEPKGGVGFSFYHGEELSRVPLDVNRIEIETLG